MARAFAKFSRRRMTSKRKNRLRVGPWPWVFFIVLCLIAAVLGTKVEEAFRIWETMHDAAVQAPPNATPARH
jgi:hypothetical protein